MMVIPIGSSFVAAFRLCILVVFWYARVQHYSKQVSLRATLLSIFVVTQLKVQGHKIRQVPLSKRHNSRTQIPRHVVTSASTKGQQVEADVPLSDRKYRLPLLNFPLEPASSRATVFKEVCAICDFECRFAPMTSGSSARSDPQI
jgi:hypothetical protein